VYQAQIIAEARITKSWYAWLVRWSACGCSVLRRTGLSVYALAQPLMSLRHVVGNLPWPPRLPSTFVWGRSLSRRIARVLCALARSWMVGMTCVDMNRYTTALVQGHYMDYLVLSACFCFVCSKCSLEMVCCFRTSAGIL
jgi:hypothetical protein